MDEARLKEVIRRLDLEYPDRTSLLDWKNPFQLTVAVALSAQTTDAAVNRVTPRLFARWPDSRSLAAADPVELEETIHSLGFFRQKAKNLIASAARLESVFGGVVPQDMDSLVSLPGIGRKSANVIRGHIWGLPGIIVDTHFGRVCRRLGLTEARDPDRVEKELCDMVPENQQHGFSMTVNFHGRRYCHARKPECESCPLDDICPRYGV